MAASSSSRLAGPGAVGSRAGNWKGCGAAVTLDPVSDPEGDGLVVAFAQLAQESCAGAGLAPGPGLLGRSVGLAEDLDHVGGPVLQAAGAEPGDGAAPPYHAGGALPDACHQPEEDADAGLR